MVLPSGEMENTGDPDARAPGLQEPAVRDGAQARRGAPASDRGAMEWAAVMEAQSDRCSGGFMAHHWCGRHPGVEPEPPREAH